MIMVKIMIVILELICWVIIGLAVLSVPAMIITFFWVNRGNDSDGVPQE
jgi:TM2 domain-containing membrane protein YozV